MGWIQLYNFLFFSFLEIAFNISGGLLLESYGLIHVWGADLIKKIYDYCCEGNRKLLILEQWTSQVHWIISTRCFPQVCSTSVYWILLSLNLGFNGAILGLISLIIKVSANLNCCKNNHKEKKKKADCAAFLVVV